MTTVISQNGYKIIKKDYSSKMIKSIKDELTVKPFNNFNKSQMNSDVGKFSVFMESPKKLYLPRFYGLEKFGQPTEDNIKEGDDIDLKFNGSLREEQNPIEEIYLKNAKEKERFKTTHNNVEGFENIPKIKVNNNDDFLKNNYYPMNSKIMSNFNIEHIKSVQNHFRN